ncbi:MAG: ABC transporter permease [Haloarculaceae archaeon]
MDSGETLRLSGRAIRAHRLRSALTVLGILIGIAAVVTFVTFGASLQADVVGQISETSANNVYLVASEDEDGFGGAGQPVFTESDLATFESVEGVQRVVPRGIVAVTAISHRGDTVARTRATATTPAAFESASFAAGESFQPGRDEVVLNRRAARTFETNATVGDTVTLTFSGGRTRNLTVVGVINGSAGGLPFEAFGSEPRVFVPTEFYDTVVESPTTGANQRVYPQVTVVADPAETGAVRDRVERTLPDTDAAELAPDDYRLLAQTSGDLADQVERIVSRLTRFVTGIAVIALVVGAVGIANIMLVSVTERTREIGIMKAIGARNREVMGLFLTEAVLLGLLGAALGVPVGVLGGWAATAYAEIPLTLAPGWFAVAVVVGVVVGAVAGLYPAWRAARVDPIEALRYE